MAIQPKIPPKLNELLVRGENKKSVDLLLTDGRKISCKFDCLTYMNTSDEDDTDVMVASVQYDYGGGELLAEDDIEMIL